MHPLLQELLAGGHRLLGTRATTTIAVPAAALNELLSLVARVPRGARVDLRDGNRLALQYPPIGVEMELPAHVDLRAAKVVPVTLSSPTVALMIRPFLRVPFVSIDGRTLSVDLAALPMPPEYRALLPYIKSIGIATTTGSMTVTLDLAVD